MTILLEYYESDFGSSNAPHEALGRAARRLMNGGALYLGGGVGVEKLAGAQGAASYSVQQQPAGKAAKFEGPLSAVMHGFSLAGGSTAADTPGGAAKVTDPAAAARLRELIDAEAENARSIQRMERRLARSAKQSPLPYTPGGTSPDDDAWERRRIDELKVEQQQIAAERALLLATGKVEEVEQARPGTNFTKIPPQNVAKLKGIIEHYKGMEHGFTACVRDQVKHGLSDDHAKRRCAVVKDLGEGTTKWRKGGKGKVNEELERLLSDAWGRVVVVEEALGSGMSVALVEAPAPGPAAPAMVRAIAEGMRADFTLLAMAGHPLALAAFGLEEGEFSEHLHPRDVLGRFQAKLLTLKAGESAELPDGNRVVRAPGADHKFYVHAPGGANPTEAGSAVVAAERALDTSARSRDPKSIGGSTRYTGVKAAIESRDAREAKTPGSGSRKQIEKVLSQLPQGGGEKYSVVNGRGAQVGHVERSASGGFTVVLPSGPRDVRSSSAAAALVDSFERGAARQEGERQRQRAGNIAHMEARDAAKKVAAKARRDAKKVGGGISGRPGPAVPSAPSRRGRPSLRAQT